MDVRTTRSCSLPSQDWQRAKIVDRSAMLDARSNIGASKSEIEGINELRARVGLWAESLHTEARESGRSIRRARPRIVHRPRLRGRADRQNERREGRSVRVGSVGGGGALRRAHPFPDRAAYAGDRLLDRRFKALRGLKAHQQVPHRLGASACRPGGGAGARSREAHQLSATVGYKATGSPPKSVFWFVGAQFCYTSRYAYFRFRSVSEHTVDVEEARRSSRPSIRHPVCLVSSRWVSVPRRSARGRASAPRRSRPGRCRPR